ncbi:MAG: hypothetical protein ACREMM_13045 [Gemmatimonadales bacterium]
MITIMTTERREFGTLRLRGRIWWVRYKISGKSYEESSGSTDRRKAEKLLARREAELGLGHFVAPDVKRTTVADLAEMLRDDYRVNGRRSLRRAETSLAHLLAYTSEEPERSRLPRTASPPTSLTARTQGRRPQRSATSWQRSSACSRSACAPGRPRTGRTSQLFR